VFRKATKIDFVSRRNFFLGLSSLLVTLSLAIFFAKGLNYGIDFSGGTEIQLQFEKAPAISELRAALEEIKIKDPAVQVFGDPKDREFLVRVQGSSSDPARFSDDIKKAIRAAIGEGIAIDRLRFVGDKAYIVFTGVIDPAAVKGALSAVAPGELSVYDVVPFGKESDYEFLATFSGVTKLIITGLQKKYGIGSFQLRREDAVGPKVGKELREKGIISILIALLFILIYIWMRFDLTFAPGAVLALLHDVTLTLGIFSLLGIEMNLPIIAALLTIVGYSLNDTIVVFDRIRENVRKLKGSKLEDIVNRSLNQTLSRTLLTSMTTLLVTLALFLFGGAIIHNFALALTIGVVVGTYSSVFVASPFVIILTKYAEMKRVKAA
jgi:preprotein translocase subunit SecF